jgi:rhamnogalacturonan endolyase
MFERMDTTNLTVIVENEEQVELSFTRTWNFSLEGKFAPLNIDKRFFFIYSIFWGNN